MVYKLYIETISNKNEIAYAYTFYNHQDFMVYKRTGISKFNDEEKAILEASAIALAYFEGSIRRRYYDEHFSTRIDEDYVTLYTKLPTIAETATAFKSSDAASFGFVGENKELWSALIPFFSQKTMMFEVSNDEKFISQTKELAKSAFKK